MVDRSESPAGEPGGRHRVADTDGWDVDDDPDDVELAPWDGRRVPVTLLGGYLGAGKTTLLNELLARTDRPIAVLVNDVGAVGIDASLIRRTHGDTIELTDGCVCCSLRAGMAAAFDGLRARETPPDHVVVELSGVADPHQVLVWGNSPGFRLDGVVVCVDAERTLDIVEDPTIGDAVTRQIAAADLAVLTKCDLVDESAIAATREAVRRLAPGSPVFRSDDPSAAAAMLDLATRRPGGVADLPLPTLFDVHETALVALPRPVLRHELDALLDALPPDVLRAKAIAQLPSGVRLLVQVVGRRRLVTELPHAEDQPSTDLVVITPRR